MATAPVPVKQSAPAPTNSPDIWRSLRTEMDRLFDRVTAGFGAGQFTPSRFFDFVSVPSPAVDITEDEAGFRLTAELPGLTEKDVEIAISGDTLTITGQKEQKREEKDRNYHLTERSYGEVRRSFYLPDAIDRDKIEAQFANGVLTLTMPKSPAAATKKIEVKAAA